MNPSINYVRSAGAIFISFFILALIDTISTTILRKFFPETQGTPPASLTLGVLILRVASGLIAGYVVAALAGTRRWLHALILAGIILSVGLLALLAARGLPIPAYSYYTPFASAFGLLLGGWLRHLRAA